jgi:hypothetical protein
VGPARETAARYRLDGVPEVLDWLEAFADARMPNLEEVEA